MSSSTSPATGSAASAAGVPETTSGTSAENPTEARLSLGWRVLLAAGGGVLLVFAFPPYGVWPFAILAVAGLTLLVRRLSARAAGLVGGAFGLVFFLGLMPWLRVIGPDAWVGLSLLCAVYIAALAIGLQVLTRLRWWPFTTAALWVAMELVRDHIPWGGFPWGRLAFANSDSWLTGWVSVAGAPLLTFIVALTAGLLAAAVVGYRSPARAAVLVVAAVLIACSGLLVPRPTDGQSVTTAVVQGNVPRTGMDAFGQREAVLHGHVDATLQLAHDVAAGTVPQPDVVIWPENASDIDPVLDQGAYDLIDHAVRAVGAPTLVGLVSETPDGSELLNSGVVWSPETGPGARYVKRHPVPFGEYVPFRSFLSHFVSRLDRVPRDFAAGSDPGVLQLGPVVAGDVICFEVAFDNLVRDVVRGGADVITVQTNNATYGGTGQVEQQLALSRLRAVEHGRSVLVAATSGISAIIAPDGTIQDEAPEFTQQVLVDDVVVRHSQTLATRVGAVPELLLTMVGFGAVAFGVISRRRRERSK
ncbi:MAG TPA: apolipoprotein N-acyltransferase [Actinomycetes bacterium]|nr:apolipoprotein N-acyltransferase [Actinomycetes bacterium]